MVQAQRPVNNAIPVDPLGLLRFCSPEQSRHLAMEQWQKGDRRRWGMIAAHLFRQDGEWGRAAAIWDELWREDQFMPALIAWLKYAEHKSRDPSLWRLALERLDSMIQNQPEDAEFSQDLLKRRLRIQLKLTKRASA